MWRNPVLRRGLADCDAAVVEPEVRPEADAEVAAGQTGREPQPAVQAARCDARRVAPGPALAAAIGGLLMGYGARLAFGCNVGAYFSGIASGSLHGWLWFAAGLVGSYLGIRLRPLFRLDHSSATGG